MLKNKKNLFYFFLQSILFILIVFVVDRITKFWMGVLLDENIIVFINDYFNLVPSWNTGISFGLMRNIPPNFFVAISCSIICYLFFLLLKEYDDFFIRSSIILMIGGAIGNVYDRIFYGAVYDFIDFHFSNYHWPTFNLADVAITLGSVIFLFVVFFKKKEF